MTQPLTVHLLPPSPNNTKVMIALAYKGIEYRPQLINPRDPADREALIAATGQGLTPAIQHGEIKLFDSCAILRYLDANFDGPRLFAVDRDEHKAIEKWENFHRYGIGPSLGKAFAMFFSGETDSKEVAAINLRIYAATENLEAALEGRQWLVGDHMTAADITVACFLVFACHTDAQAGQSIVWKWMKDRFDLGENRENCRAHVERVFAFLPDLAALAAN
jgi:glutathione S-transferase